MSSAGRAWKRGLRGSLRVRARGLGVLGSLALGSALALCAGGCEDPHLRAIGEADRMFREGLFEQAAAAYGSLPPELGSWQAYGAWRSAVIYRTSLRDPERARQAYLACAKAWTDTEFGYACQVELGDLLRDEADHRAAIGSYRAALQVQPDGASADHCLLESGRAYVALGDPQQARVEWQELLREHKGSALAPTARLEIARSWDLQEEPKHALKAYRSLRERYADSDLAVMAAFGEAEALEQLGRLDEAASVFRSLLKTHPNPDAVRVKLEAVVERERRRNREPLPVMDQGRDLAPK